MTRYCGPAGDRSPAGRGLGLGLFHSVTRPRRVRKAPLRHGLYHQPLAAGLGTAQSVQ